MDPTFPLVPIANIVACLLILLSISKSMFQSWNIGACSLALWTALSAFKFAVNSIIWSRSIENLAPVWCDISTRIEIASDAGIPVASFVITRRLSLMISRRNTPTEGRVRRDPLFDLLLCIACPVIQVVLYYVVQGARFQVLEELGCAPVLGNFGLSFLLMNSMSLTFPLISLVLYSPRLILAYFKHKKDLSVTLASNTTLSRHAFFKLFALGLFDIFVTLPVSVTILVLDLLQLDKLALWPGWKASHASFTSVVMITAEEWKASGVWISIIVGFNQWVNPVYAVTFFLLFGITESKRAWYRSLFWKSMRPFGFKPRIDLVASNIVFGSGPMAGSSIEGPRTVTVEERSTTSLGSIESRSFDDATKMEEAGIASSDVDLSTDFSSKESVKEGLSI